MSLLNQLTEKNNQTDLSNVDIISLTAVNHLFNKKNLKTNTRINKEQVGILTKLNLFAETFKTSFTKKLADNIAEFQVSLGGLGRKETIALVQKSKDDQIELPKVKDLYR